MGKEQDHAAKIRLVTLMHQGQPWQEEKATADAEIEEYQQRQWKAYHTSNRECAKCERYCREQRELLRAIEDLAHQEREMYELDNRKDQIMTVCKLALANVGMWVRDRYFPAEFAHASWHRLQPFFQLPGWIHWGEIASRWNSSH